MTLEVPIPDDRIKSEKQLVEFASDLQDSEVTQVGKIIAQLSAKYSTKRASVENLEAFRAAQALYCPTMWKQPVSTGSVSTGRPSRH